MQMNATQNRWLVMFIKKFQNNHQSRKIFINIVTNTINNFKNYYFCSINTYQSVLLEYYLPFDLFYLFVY